ncbi:MULTISPECIES: hypothetical protein [Bacillus cereus group]|uniref:hypothetical protein n=1 Tax=Bacillus cereus group TaxID=86661 RepID=UPI000BF86E2C|nr:MULTISPECIES: hypothetical protein [Bacillus cereus group]PFA24823.1 hypothetical protein CN373_02970 [Bacillus cereus]PFN09250.1 hypothetical protein COJ55_03550 [Bacillus cereus]PFO82958.1 hypothetical protein COJ77_10135 [Bacillus cereus]PFR27664.1 hypothetical protein COK19_09845 [Bacillus cereus]PGZ13356.1 hypothetical protein COE46_20930 [Bacillus cereus]
MNFKKIKIILGVLLLLILSTFLMTKESKIKDFPVFIFSNHVEDDNPADYQYTFGYLPLMSIRVKGWKKIQEEGATTVFEKENRKVIVIKLPGEDNFYLYEPKNKH